MLKAGQFTVTELYRAGMFNSEAEARGAFELAYQQAMDGMGRSISSWMGMTKGELVEYIRDDILPPKRAGKAES